MLDIKFIREHKDFIKEAARKKRISFDVEALVDLDDKRKVILASIEAKKTERDGEETGHNFAINPKSLKFAPC